MRFALFLSLVGWTLCCTLAIAPQAQAQQGEWSTPINLSNTMTKSWIPAIATDKAGNIHVVWGENLDGSGWADAIYYTMWNGTSWSKPNDILVSPSTTEADMPAIAVDSKGLIHVVWEGFPGIFYSQAQANGTPWMASAWSSPFAISRRGTGRADIAINAADNIHVVWVDWPSVPWFLDGQPCQNCTETYYARSTDGGRTWSNPVALSSSPERSAYPHLAVDDNGVLHAAWDEHTLDDAAITCQYTRSTDGGINWSEPIDLAEDTGVTEKIGGVYVGLCGRGRVCLTWGIGGTISTLSSKNFLRWSSDSGETWSAVTEIPDFPGPRYYSYLETATNSADELYITFAAGSGGDTEAYCGQWADGRWLSLTDVSNTPRSYSSRPRIAVSEGNIVHLVWFEHLEGQKHIHDGGRMDIFYSRLETEAPHLPPQPLPTLSPVTPTPTLEPTSQATATPLPTPTRPMTPIQPDSAAGLIPNPVYPIILGMAPVFALIGLVILSRLWGNHPRGRR